MKPSGRTLAIALLVPTAVVLVGIGFGALGIGFGRLASAGSVALVLSPLVLIGWLLWRLLRERPAPIAASSP